jgi:Domain of unknown function (DUF6431)
MLTVGKDRRVVEWRLKRGRLHCPGCDGLLAPWGYARRRTVWGAGWTRRFRPRRTRCRGCGTTHVLMPVNVLWHRRDDVEVIGEVFARSAAGQGFRGIAAAVGRPEATVRGWIRRMRACAERVRVGFTVVLAGLGDPPALAAAGAMVADAVNAVMAVAVAAGRRFPELVAAGVDPWEMAGAVTGGMLLAPPIIAWRINTNRTLAALLP